MADKSEQFQPLDHQASRPGPLAMCVGLMVFLCVAFIAALFDRQQTKIHQLAAEVNAAEIGVQLAEAIENEISKRLVAVQALAAFKKTNGTFSHKEFEDFASEVEAGDSAIISLQFAPDGVVRYVTKPERNTRAIGHDLLADPARSQLAYRSIETGNFLIAGPVNLRQGGLGLIARKPLYEDTPEGQHEFWGFATIVLDFATVTDLLSGKNERSQYRHALMTGQSKVNKDQVFWGDPDIFDEDPHCAAIQLATGTWQLATIPNSGWPTGWPFATSFRLVSLVVATIMAALSVTFLNKPAQLRRAISVATADLKETEKRLRDAHRLAKIGSWTLQADGEFACSKEALELLGVKSSASWFRIGAFYSAIHPDDRRRVRSEIESAIDRSDKVEATFRVKWGDGTIRTFKMNAEESMASDQSVQRFRGTIQDITEETENEQRLRRAQKMEAIGQLTGGIAHDFNNLLTVIQGNAELLELTQSYDQDLLGDIQKAAHRGASLTHRLLAYARKQPLSPKVTNLAVLVQGMERILTHSLDEHIDIVLDFPKDMWRVKVDSGQLEDAILNLAINARDAMKKGGKLLIKCENTTIDNQQGLHGPEVEDGKYVVLSVSDSGTGMDENIMARAFEPFFTTKAVGEGSGLGLSMVCGLARQSGGGVTIESEINQGTTVKLYLPFKEHASEPAITERQSVNVPYGSGEVILVVEDNSVVGRVVSRTLVELGYKTLEAPNAIDAQKILQTRNDIDLVLTDVVLPGGMSGIDLATEIKRAGVPPAVVVMSGYPLVSQGAHEDVLSELQLLKKPFTREALAQALRGKLKDVPRERSNVTRVNFLHA